MKILKTSLKTLIKEELSKLNEQYRYDADSFLQAIQQLGQLFSEKSLEYAVPYPHGHPSPPKQPTTGEELPSYFSEYIKHSAEQGLTPTFRLSAIEVDKDKMESWDAWKKLSTIIQRLRVGSFDYDIERVVEFFKQNPQLIDVVKYIRFDVSDRSTRADAARMQRGDYGRLD